MKREELLYLETHEWAFVEGNKAKVGITLYASTHLGDIVFFDLPNVGDKFSKGDEFGAVESVKSASDLYLPLSGTITAVNEELVDSPELVNEDPYENWIIEVEFDNEAELKELLSLDEYNNTL